MSLPGGTTIDRSSEADAVPPPASTNYKLSVCIPTYNRSVFLVNCLHSIAANRGHIGIDVQLCISDNCSTDDTEAIVREAQQHVPIKYSRNATNIGLVRNILRTAEMADGEFIWMIGNDDLLMPNALDEIIELITRHRQIEYFFVNSSHLSAEYVLAFPQPFALSNLPAGMPRYSPRQFSGEIPFMDLVDPGIAFDFLGGIFLSVFKREKWIANVTVLDPAAMASDEMFSHFDNTFPHVKIFANAFARSGAYFCATPLSVCLAGVREWAPMYPLVHSVRLVEALDEYRKHGLPYGRYWHCKNYALNNFVADFCFMLLHRRESGFAYLRPLRMFLDYCWYPNVYFSFISFCVRKLKRLLPQGNGTI